jgi:hypothetical protein
LTRTIRTGLSRHGLGGRIDVILADNATTG